MDALWRKAGGAARMCEDAREVGAQRRAWECAAGGACVPTGRVCFFVRRIRGSKTPAYFHGALRAPARKPSARGTWECGAGGACVPAGRVCFCARIRGSKTPAYFHRALRAPARRARGRVVAEGSGSARGTWECGAGGACVPTGRVCFLCADTGVEDPRLFSSGPPGPSEKATSSSRCAACVCGGGGCTS